jgi:hypothetical protein
LRIDCRTLIDPKFDIPFRRGAIPGEHIFRPLQAEKDVDLKIPADKPNLNDAKYHHVRDFNDFLPSAAGAIKKAIDLVGPEHVFTPTVLERGNNLRNGAYVLQLLVQNEGLDVWTVRYLVGASYSYETHVGYFQMSKANAAVNHIATVTVGNRKECVWCFGIKLLFFYYFFLQFSSLLSFRRSAVVIA